MATAAHLPLDYQPPAPEAILHRHQGREPTAAYATGLTYRVVSFTGGGQYSKGQSR